MTEHDRLYLIYENLLLTKAKELYPVPATYKFKRNDEYSTLYKVNGFIARNLSYNNKIQNILENILAILNGHCNIVGVSGFMKGNRSEELNLVIGTNKSIYEATRI